MNSHNSQIRVAFNGVPLLSPLTGVGQYAKSLLNGFRKRKDIQFLNFYAKGWSDEICEQSLSASVMRWKSIIKKVIPNAYGVSRVVQQFRFTNGLSKFKPDVYHEPNFLAYKFDGPTVITVHDLSWVRFPEMHPIDRVRAMDKLFEPALRRANRVITDSYFVKQELIDVFGINPNVVTPVHLGADDLFKPIGIQMGSVLEKLWLSQGKYLLAVGTLEPRKNLQVALEAYAMLPNELRENYPLVLVGMKGWKTSALEKKLAPMLASGQVRQLGYLTREELAIVTAGATAMVYPSVYEGFGLPLLESMSCGVPVIASNVSSVPEVVGDSGVLLDPADIHGFALSMQELMEDSAQRSRLSEKALLRSQIFSWEHCVDQTVGVYRAALA
jgi:alpha-1,3-rhamnosyl/mannosyltransferase